MLKELAQNPVDTAANFNQTWRGQHHKRLEAELLSIAKETKREPDIYHFLVKEDLLIEPETERPIKDFIAPGIELEIANELERWATENESGAAYWLSPRIKGLYPCDKIILHEIKNSPEGKTVKNTAILFDADLPNPERLRSQLIVLEDENALSELVNWIQLITGKGVQEIDPTTLAYYKEKSSWYARQIIQGAHPKELARQMKEDGFLGDNPVSCTRRGSYIESRSTTIAVGNPLVNSEFRSKTFTCPRCDGKIESGKGITTCPHCGLTKEEAGSTCD